MKSISRWIFWLVFARLAVCLGSGEFMILSGPEYNRGNLLHTFHNAKEMYCITDEIGSALTWNSNLEWMESDYKNLNQVDKSHVISNEKFVYPAKDKLNCQMDSTSQCSQHWRRIGNWSYVTSLREPMSPLFDSRWEDFEEIKTPDRWRAINTVPNSGSFAVSIRGTSDAHFALCDGNNPKSFCFYIILGGWKNTQSVIRKCETGIPDTASEMPKGDCLKKLVTYNGTILSSTEWKTFVISWNFDRQTLLNVYDSKTVYLSHNEPKKSNSFNGRRDPSGNIQYSLFARSLGQTLMKFHIYGYSYTLTTQSKLFSPETMTTSSDRNICIEMSISMCEKCLMTVDFVDRNGQKSPAATFRNKWPNNLYNLPTWRNVKINKTLSIEMQQPITLSIITLLSNNTVKNNPYWAVSNIRRCHDGAFKAIKIKVHQDHDGSNYFWPNVTCQKLSPPEDSFIIDSANYKMTSLNPETRLSCPEGKIGSSCTVSCSKLFWDNSDCHRLLACDNNGCSCAQGFTFPSCKEYCPTSSYGFECKQKCGNCTDNSCSFATGECKKGCQYNRNKIFFPPYCKMGVGTPSAPTVDVINSTCVRVSLSMQKEYKIVPTSIDFEIWSNSTYPVFTSDRIIIKKNTITIEAFAEHLSPGTQYKSVAVLHSSDRTFRGEPGNFTTPCTESVALNFVIVNNNETSITVNNWVDVHVNDSCPYTWYNVQLFNSKQKLFDEVTSFPKTFLGLEPFTDYKVIVSSEKNIIINKLVKTPEGAPGPVTDLQNVPRVNGEILLTWKPPEKTNGRIVNYTIEIEPFESLGCKDLGKLSYKLITNYTGIEFDMKNTITNTTAHSFIHKTIGLRPYTKYIVKIYASTSKHHGEVIVLYHATDPSPVPTEVPSNLRMTNETSGTVGAYLKWDYPNDCTSISGPIHASKLLIRKLSATEFLEVETKNFSFPLKKSDFNGTESYEARLYLLRDLRASENKTAYTSLKFTMPARAPPPVRRIELVEIDTISRMATLRWEAPLPPLHGHLEFYSVNFCDVNQGYCDQKNSTIIHINETCRLWNLTEKICKTVPIPATGYDQIQVRAFNQNVTEESEPAIIPITVKEFDPDAPSNLSLLHRSNSSVELSWFHPWRSGGRIERFIIETRLLSSHLKNVPWKDKINFLEIGAYQPRYSTEMELLPSSSLAVSVKAVTAGGLAGEKIERRLELPNAAKFATDHLNPKTDDEMRITIRIPGIVNDVRSSAIVLLVQSARHCDKVSSREEEDIGAFEGRVSDPYYKHIWKAAILMDPGLYANKEFKIGDGEVYSGSRNYALCSKESYIVHVMLVENSTNFIKEYPRISSKHILKSIRTSPIRLGELSQNYVMWLTPLFLIVLILVLFGFIAYKKKFASQFLKNKQNICQQENMPLSNDFEKKKPIIATDKVEKGAKIKESMDLSKNNLFIVENNMDYVMPVRVENFVHYFESAYKSGALKKEYLTIKSGLTKPCTYGSQLELKPKNRFANLFPYDDSRVVLENLPDDPYSDYINANFITGYKGKKKAYIATQGPKPNTVVDFWRMIWQERVQIICMMANLVENGKVKCEQYWPSEVGKKVLYGTVSVQFCSEEVHSDYTCRRLRVSCGSGGIRTIEHLHYTAWPDHGVPSDPRSLVAFLKEIQKLSPAPRAPSDPPIVVHCSAGVGRTGTLIVLDIAVCRAFSEQVVDVFANVISVRQERLNMVDNTEQYLLLHLVLVVYFDTHSTCLNCDNTLLLRIAEEKKNSAVQYERILDTNWWNEVLGSPPLPEKSLSNRNKIKLRFPESAGGFNRPYLKRSNITDEDSDYIAATCVRKTFKDCEYITTQLPLPSTSADFWRMVSEKDIELVVVLQLPDLNDPTYCEIVPENQGFGSTKYLKIIRQENSSKDSQYYFKEEVIIIDSSEPSKNQTVKIFTYKNWFMHSLPPADELVKLWEVLEKSPKKDNRPIVVVCRNGVTASGLWLTISFLLKRMSMDKKCDVPQAVRAIRSCRKDFLDKPEYLEYLYTIASAWFVEKS